MDSFTTAKFEIIIYNTDDGQANASDGKTYDEIYHGHLWKIRRRHEEVVQTDLDDMAKLEKEIPLIKGRKKP